MPSDTIHSTVNGKWKMRWGGGGGGGGDENGVEGSGDGKEDIALWGKHYSKPNFSHCIVNAIIYFHIIHRSTGFPFIYASIYYWKVPCGQWCLCSQMGL